MPPLLPAGSHTLKYGLLTARGKEGGRAGVKVDTEAVIESKQLSAVKNKVCMAE